MGEVYLGHDTVLDRAVAIKLIGSKNPDASSRERFLIEARAIARLSHPNVVAIFRVGTTGDGRPFLVQEMIRGRSLDHVPRPMPWREVCELAIGIARGLGAAHRRGILHRDVKPANVMLDETGTARLLDFGLAKLDEVAAPPRVAITPQVAADVGVAVTRDAHDVTVTRDAPRDAPISSQRSSAPVVVHTAPGALIGTPRYTAPENWRGEASTAASDLYSLGVMLYELLTGAPPYPQTELDELRRAVLAGGATPLLERAPETHAVFAGLVMRCLAVDPHARPGSAAELLHALEAVLVDAPEVPDGNPYRGLRPFDAAHRGLFFGRGTDVSILVDRLRTETLLVVVGDSGIGKSSVCHAGVAPAVLAGALGDRRAWRTVTVTLGRTPWATLCEALGIAALDARTLRPAADAGILLVVDQLEELVTLGDPAEAARVAELLGAIAEGVPGVKALLAVRGDFLTRVAALPALGAPMTRGLHLLRTLSRDDLREAIVGPARAKGVRYASDAMVDTLVDAVGTNPGALPLLQFTLAELWQARDGDVIPERALAALGGVDGALAGHADRVLLELGARERAAARRIVMRLVSDARTRAVRPRDELADDPIATAALESLVRGRLVVARDTVAGTPTYELAHEALIRNWNTLRDWLDEAAGEGAARNRLIGSASEWHRLERKPDLLWSRRQLDEVRALADLSATERAFVAASHAQLRRRRVARIAAIAAVPVIAAAIYAGVRFDAARRRDREVGARVAAAAEHRATGDRLAKEAAAARTSAFTLFDMSTTLAFFELDPTAEAERAWAAARASAADADGAYRRATRELEGAFLVEAGSVRRPMADLLWVQAELAEAMHDHVRVAELVDRLAGYDAGLRASWDAPAHLAITTDMPATLAIHAAAGGGFETAPIGTGSRLDLDLPPGSYLVVATSEVGVARLPILLARGERVTETIALPRTALEGFVYVPAGRFLFGTARDDSYRREFLRTEPLHAIEGSAFWIARDELTFGEWLAFVRTLPAEARTAYLPRTEGSAKAVRVEQQDDRFVLAFSPETAWVRAAEGEPVVYPGREIRQSVRWERMPVVGISAALVTAYTSWLDRTGRLPGARLCTVREWERAARGADGRSFPHGETLTIADANFDATYNRRGFGLDEVGSFRSSDSPFGISDLAGNAAELVQLVDGVAIKGGSYYQGFVTALSSNTSFITETTRSTLVGVRLCASANPAR